MDESIPAAPTQPVQFTDSATGLVATKHDGQVWFKSGDSYFSADSIQQGLEHDPNADLATPDEVSHRIAVRAQDSGAGATKAFAKQAAAHTIDAATGIIRYPALGLASLLGDQKALDGIQQLGGQQVMENVYGIASELLSGQNQEAAGREFGEATRNQNEANPGAGMAGGIVGDIAPLIATGGLAAGGKVSGKLLSETIAEHTVGRLGTGLAARVGTRALAGAIQGVGYGEQAASEAAYMQNEPLTRQKLWASGAMGGLFGGAISGGVGLVAEGAGTARSRLVDVLGRVAKPVPKGSLAEAIGDSTVTKEAAQEVADRVMGAEGVPAAPGLGEKLHSLLTDIQAATSDGEKSAIHDYGLGAILDPKTRVKALSGLQIFRDRPLIIEKATGEIAESMSALEKHAGDTVFESVRDLGMKRNAWEKLVDPAKRGEQVDAARAMLGDAQAKLEGMLPKKAEAEAVGLESGVENFDYARDGMRDMRVHRGGYEGATPEEVQQIARGERPSMNSESAFKPVRVHVEADGQIHLNDGRHRLLAAKEAGAKDIAAEVVTYDAAGNPISKELRNLQIAKTEVAAEESAFGDAARIKSALGHANRAAKALEGDADGAAAAIELDAFKRSLGKLTKGSVKRYQDLTSKGDFAAESVGETARVFSDTYEKLRQGLMNEELWGKAGTAQKEINQGWQNWIDSRSMYRGNLMRRTGTEGSGEFGMWDTRARYEIDPEKVGGWIDKFGTGRGKLADEYTRAHIDATENLTKTIGKYVDSGELATSVQAVRDAAEKIKSNLKVATETVAVANQVQLAGSAHMGAAAKMGMAAAGAMAAGPIGGAAGAALGFIMSPGKVMNAAMAIQGLLSKVDAEKASALKSFFGSASRTVGSAAKKAETVGEFAAHTQALNDSGALDSKVTRRAMAAASARGAQFFSSGGQARADQYQKRREQLAMLTSNPDMANHQIQTTLGALPGIAPQLASSMAMDAMRNLSLLQQMAPPASPIGGMFGGKRKTFTPDSEIRKFAAQWDGVMSPLSVLRDLRSGSLNMDKVNAARMAHPELFTEIAGEFLEQMAEMKEPMDPQAARQADLLLGLNGAGDPSIAPDFLARIAMLNQADQNDRRSPPTARPPVNLAKGTATLSQSLEGV